MVAFEFLGEKLKKIREDSGFTQGQIAQYLDVDQSLISRFEKNERQLNVELLEKLANLFGCPPAYFTDEDFAYRPLPYAMRASCIEVEDFETIAVMNKIALNLRNMEEMLKGESC